MAAPQMTASSGLILLIELLSIEEVGDELGDPWDTGGTTDQDDLVDVGLVDPRIGDDLLNGVKDAWNRSWHSSSKRVRVREGTKIDALEERVDFDGSGDNEGEDSLGTLAGGTETTESTKVGGRDPSCSCARIPGRSS
jgi:hypothetical protein